MGTKLSKNLVLTGMMGVGKSTIAKSLAEKLSFRFVDVDGLIEQSEGCSISKIFKNKSEEYFRELETKFTLQELKKSKSIIALGGGAFLNNTIRLIVKNTAISFWLDLDINEIIKRLKVSKKRPLLLNKNLNEEIKKIYLKRKKTYGEADFRVKCNFLKPKIIVNKIVKLYENSRNKI